MHFPAEPGRSNFLSANMREKMVKKRMNVGGEGMQKGDQDHESRASVQIRRSEEMRAEI
jgi:hypothetical protein